ncbi:MAG: AEC family transporter [Lachnospiraceae bacterium]
MNNLYLSFSVVFPLFCMMALGYLLKVIGIFDSQFLAQLNNLCFKVFLPTILFIHVYHSNFQGNFSVKLIVFAIGCVILCFLSLLFLVPLFEKDHKKQGVIIQGIFRSNFILFGIPITTALYGNNNASTTAILIAFVIPLFNTLSVIALEYFSNKKANAKQIIKGIIRNPLIIASAIAFLFVLTGIKLPILIEKTVTDISKIATPLALIILGGSFAFKNLTHSLKALFFSILGKLILVPLIFIFLSIRLGFKGMDLVALFAMFASPTAVSSYTMAQSADADSVLAGQIVVVSSIASILTIFIWITLLKWIGVI